MGGRMTDAHPLLTSIRPRRVEKEKAKSATLELLAYLLVIMEWRDAVCPMPISKEGDGVGLETNLFFRGGYDFLLPSRELNILVPY